MPYGVCCSAHLHAPRFTFSLSGPDRRATFSGTTISCDIITQAMADERSTLRYLLSDLARSGTSGPTTAKCDY